MLLKSKYFSRVLVGIGLAISAAVLGSFYEIWTSHASNLQDFSALVGCISKNPRAPESGACLNSVVHQLLQKNPTISLMNYITATTSPKVVTGSCHEIAH